MSSIVETDGAVAAAAVYEPVARGMFTATATVGGGASLNGRRTGPSRQMRRDRALIGVSNDSAKPTNTLVADAMRTVWPQVGDIRRLPAFLQLVHVGIGRLEAGIVVLQPWDAAAGLLIAGRAGACLGDAGPGRPRRPMTVAACPGLWAPFHGLIGTTRLA